MQIETKGLQEAFGVNLRSGKSERMKWDHRRSMALQYGVNSFGGVIVVYAAATSGLGCPAIETKHHVDVYGSRRRTSYRKSRRRTRLGRTWADQWRTKISFWGHKFN